MFCDERFKGYISEPNIKGKLDSVDPYKSQGVVQEQPRSNYYYSQNMQEYNTYHSNNTDPFKRKEMKKKINNSVKNKKKETNSGFEGNKRMVGYQTPGFQQSGFSHNQLNILEPEFSAPMFTQKFSKFFQNGEPNTTHNTTGKQNDLRF